MDSRAVPYPKCPPAPSRSRLSCDPNDEGHGQQGPSCIAALRTPPEATEQGQKAAARRGQGGDPGGPLCSLLEERAWLRVRLSASLPRGRAASPWPRSGCRTGRPGCARSPSCSGVGRRLRDARGRRAGCGESAAPPPALIGRAPPAAPGRRLRVANRGAAANAAPACSLGPGPRAAEGGGWFRGDNGSPLGLGPRPVALHRGSFFANLFWDPPPYAHPEGPRWTPPTPRLWHEGTDKVLRTPLDP